MSMGNFIDRGGEGVPVMAAKESLVGYQRSDPDEPDAGVGMAHPTIVPTNFDPEASE